MLVGQRGWETENVVDMLERCPALRGTVIEHNTLPDAEMVRLLKGARALLLPSFAEGFGFPLIEAFGLGVPALCSDIPALRETGGEVPEYLDPLDGPGWRAAILDYAAPGSPRRAGAARAAGAAGGRRAGRSTFANVDRFIAETAAAPRSAIDRGATAPTATVSRGGAPPPPDRSARRQPRALPRSRIATASRTCASLCAAVRKKRSRAARSGTAG